MKLAFKNTVVYSTDGNESYVYSILSSNVELCSLPIWLHFRAEWRNIHYYVQNSLVLTAASGRKLYWFYNSKKKNFTYLTLSSSKHLPGVKWYSTFPQQSYCLLLEVLNLWELRLMHRVWSILDLEFQFIFLSWSSKFWKKLNRVFLWVSHSSSTSRLQGFLGPPHISGENGLEDC